MGNFKKSVCKLMLMCTFGASIGAPLSPILSPIAVAGEWKGWPKFWRSIDPTNPKTWSNLDSSTQDLLNRFAKWLKKKKKESGVQIVIIWGGHRYPGLWIWNNLTDAWANPRKYDGLMTTVDNVEIVAKDYIPQVAKEDNHFKICSELEEGIRRGAEKETGNSLKAAILQMEEEGCEIPGWVASIKEEIERKEKEEDAKGLGDVNFLFKQFIQEEEEEASFLLALEQKAEAFITEFFPHRALIDQAFLHNHMLTGNNLGVTGGFTGAKLSAQEEAYNNVLRRYNKTVTEYQKTMRDCKKAIEQAKQAYKEREIKKRKEEQRIKEEVMIWQENEENAKALSADIERINRKYAETIEIQKEFIQSLENLENQNFDDRFDRFMNFYKGGNK